MRLSPKRERDRWLDRLFLTQKLRDQGGFIRPFDMFRPTSKGFYSYKLNQSCRFNDDDSAFLTWTPGSAGTEETFTWSAWVKRCNLGSIQQLFNAAAGNEIQFTAADKLQFTTASATLLTTQLFRDPTNWMHIVLAVDTTQATAADRVNLYINGLEVADFDTETYPNLNEVTEFGKAAQHHLGSNEGGTEEFDGYMAEVQYTDGTQEPATKYGQTKEATWIPKSYSGPYGTYGWKLDFADSAALGNDVSGNGNDWTPSGLAANDQVVDTPTNNHPTLDPTNMPTASVALENGNLCMKYNAAGWATSYLTKLLPSSGKWYFELTLGADIQYYLMGVADVRDTFNPIVSSGYIGQDAYGWGFMCNGASAVYQKYTGDAGTTITGATPSASDVMQVAIDMDAGKIWFGVNNTWLDSGDPAAGTNEIYSSMADELSFGLSVNSVNDSDAVLDCGQLGFAYTPPTGFKALNSDNLPSPAILDPSEAHDILTWTGDASDDRAIGSLSFDPSAGALMISRIYGAVKNNFVYDTVRGVTQSLLTNEIDIEVTEGGNILQQFTSSGIEVGSADPGLNDNANNYLAWLFRLGAAYGVHIVLDVGTGAAHAITHGAGFLPEMLWRKSRDTAYSWHVYHHHALNRTDPETDYGLLNTADGWTDDAQMWNDTAPTLTEFTVGVHERTNLLNDNFVTMLFASIPQFSKVYSYTGNGDASGPVVRCGFRPRTVIIKKANASDSWVVHNSTRDPYNPVAKRLLLEATNAEVGDTLVCDFLSDGFKIRHINSFANTSTGTYVGVAFAEQPGKYSNAR